MKAITITIPEDLDAPSAHEAKKREISKSALIRAGLDALLTGQEPPRTGNAWVDLAGFGSRGVSGDPNDIDEIVYGR